ncbi:MAG: hypothetical protein Q8N26_24795 [Myxococcales bacterium]|nr:hypothetical protein [Myxococcales bacterium]
MTLRWAFPDSSEQDARAAVDARIDAWWAALSSRRAELDAFLRGEGRFDLPSFVSEQLSAIDSELCWELAPASKPRLVISCEAERQLQPLVRRVVSRAPAELGLELFDHRPAEPLEAALFKARGQTGIDGAGWTVELSEQPYGLLDLCWRSSRTDEKAQHAAFVMTQTLLGEKTLPDWVAQVTVDAPPSILSKLLGAGRTAALSATSLPGRVEALKRSWLDRQADQPLLVSSRVGRDANWSLVRLEPQPASDFPGQKDLQSARTANVDFFKATRSGAPFASSRFSRFGETFLYVKTDGFGDDGFSNTLAMEEALDQALADGHLGRAIGAGTGTRYSYVDLVVSDPARALERIVPVLREGKLPRRAWLLFFDDTLAAEWVGVWPETPPPPSFPASQ